MEEVSPLIINAHSHYVVFQRLWNGIPPHDFTVGDKYLIGREGYNPSPGKGEPGH